MATLTKLLLPALAAATAAGGGVTAASARQVAAVLFSDVLLTVIDSLLLPMVYLYIGVAAAGAVLEENALETIGELLKKVVVWVLSGLLVLFTTFLTRQRRHRGPRRRPGGAAGQVGGERGGAGGGGASSSDAAESVMAGAGILKGDDRGLRRPGGAVGLPWSPFLRLGCQYRPLPGGGAGGRGGRGRKTSPPCCGSWGDAFGLVLAMTRGPPPLLLIITTLR